MIFSCKDIQKTYGVDVILEKISFHIEDREKAAIVGVNGAGKTTLFKILTGELSADGGELFLRKDVSLGYMAQNQQIDGKCTIYEEMISVFQDLIKIPKMINNMSKNYKYYLRYYGNNIFPTETVLIAIPVN